MRIEKIRTSEDFFMWLVDQAAHFLVLGFAPAWLAGYLTNSFTVTMSVVFLLSSGREIVQWFSKDRTGAGWLQVIDPVVDVTFALLGGLVAWHILTR